MSDNTFVSGMVALGTGLLSSSLSSFFGHVTVFGALTSFVQGFLDGISVVAFLAALILLVRSRKAAGG